MEKSGIRVWKSKTGFPLLLCGFILPFNHLAAQATVPGGRKTSVSHFQKQQVQTFSFTELILH